MLSSVPVCTWGLLIRQAFDLSILNPLTFRRVALLTSKAVFLPPTPLFLPDKITPGLCIDLKAECQMQPTPVQGQTLNSLNPHAQLTRGKEVSRGSFCSLSRTWGQAQGSQFFIVSLNHQQQDQPSLLRLHLGALSSFPSACEQRMG